MQMVQGGHDCRSAVLGPGHGLGILLCEDSSRWLLVFGAEGVMKGHFGMRCNGGLDGDIPVRFIKRCTGYKTSNTISSKDNVSSNDEQKGRIGYWA